ncbi:4850_t:CDS:2 [Diversispora eburnea]|uniref:4850_t:CDS:1 n=1 Tax=Diversispora eburnea TaxID=1213867 RepID=A0A9N8ZGJ8_9GLOM|nr:4850_t:CDS:2 [Diversispora eburnea]
MSNLFQLFSVMPEPTEAMIEEAKIDYALRLYHYTQLQLERMKFKKNQLFHHSSSVTRKRSHINNFLNNKRSNNNISSLLVIDRI